MQITKTRLKQIQQTTLLAAYGINHEARLIPTTIEAFKKIIDIHIDNYNQEVERRKKMKENLKRVEPIEPYRPARLKAEKRRRLVDSTWLFALILSFVCGFAVAYFGLK